ncbi:MAG: glutathione peroxidase [candidate division FCPU426 bacterium]
MLFNRKILVTLFVMTLPFAALSKENHAVKETGLYSFVMKDIDGKDKKLSDYKGEVLLIVNVASQCGNTPQYKSLQEAYKKYHAKGFEVLGFPANDFGHQEPGSEDEIKKFCDTEYHVTFPLFSKITVKGEGKHPLYHYLTEETDFKGEVGWNFGKFLADRQGHIVARFAPGTSVDSKEVLAAMEKALSEKKGKL